jgi:hypothetical protein
MDFVSFPWAIAVGEKSVSWTMESGGDAKDPAGV